MKKTWKDVDWIELGCRGWEIDTSGAWLMNPDADMDHVHLCFHSLDLIIGGSPEWVERVVGDLRAAGVMTPYWTITTGSTAGSGSVTCMMYTP